MTVKEQKLGPFHPASPHPHVNMYTNLKCLFYLMNVSWYIMGFVGFL